MGRVRAYFVTGLVIIIPLGVTLFFLSLLFGWLDGVLQPVLTPLLPRYYPGLGVLVGLGVIVATGALASNLLGRRLIEMGQHVLMRTPLVRSIYATSRQVVDVFFDESTNPFEKVVLLEYPRRGLYTLGFVTSDARGEIQRKTRRKMVNVFVPTTPNPTSGFLIMVPPNHVIRLDMSVDEGIKLVMSGGMLMPQDGAEGGEDTEHVVDTTLETD